MTAPSAAYSRLQIVLHWLVVAMLAVQFFTHEGVHDIERAARRGTEVEPFSLLLAGIHKWDGIAILAVVARRLVLRATHGAPAPEPGMGLWQERAARYTHVALYALLFAVPLTGAAAVWITSEAGDLHETLVPARWTVAFLHVAAALFHYAVQRDNVLQRMVPALRLR